MRVSRRGLLILSTAGLAGCAPGEIVSPEPTPPELVTPGPSMSEPGLTSEPPTELPSEPIPTAEPTPLPTREEILARYEGRPPAQWGLDVDGVILRGEGDHVAITLDACGGPNGSGYDEDLIQHLRHLEVPATLFLNARWIDANPDVAADLAADPLFELANHGLNHLPLSVSGQAAYGIPGTTSVGEAYDEVVGGAERLAELTGEMPRWFRSGTAHVDDVAVEITRDLGMATVNFDINGDAGATFTAAQVRQAMLAAQPGSVCIGHFNRPGSGTATGMARALEELIGQGFAFTQLRDALTVG